MWIWQGYQGRKVETLKGELHGEKTKTQTETSSKQDLRMHVPQRYLVVVIVFLHRFTWKMASASVKELFAIVFAEQGKDKVSFQDFSLRWVEQALSMWRAKCTLDLVQQLPTFCVVGHRKYLKAISQKQMSFQLCDADYFCPPVSRKV